MNRFVKGLTVAVVATAACSDGTPTVTAEEPAPQAKSVRLSPRNLLLAANSSLDVQVTTVGFAAGVLHECRLEPTAIGTVAAVPGACRITTGATLLPGRLIARVETVADTAIIVIFAGR